MKQAWYLGHRSDEVADCALLVGDPDRIDRIAALMDAPHFLPVKRGLRTVTGTYNGKLATAVSFGMGAPIATVVMHELADLGTSAFMRIGTAMFFDPAVPGQFLLCDGIASFEGTSPAYVGTLDGQTADSGLNASVLAMARAKNLPIAEGTFATFDAFYRDMFPLEAEATSRVAERLAAAEKRGAIAADMETSALVNAAHALDVAFTSLCIGTVDAKSREKLNAQTTAEREQQMFALALGALTENTTHRSSETA